MCAVCGVFEPRSKNAVKEPVLIENMLKALIHRGENEVTPNIRRRQFAPGYLDEETWGRLEAMRDRLTSEAGLTRPLAWREVIEVLLAREEARTASSVARKGEAT
jgi:hypothetical protein